MQRVIFMVLLGTIFCMTGCREEPVPKAPTDTPTNTWIQLKARECKGDFYRLSQADQEKAKQLMGPNAVQGMRTMYSPAPMP